MTVRSVALDVYTDSGGTTRAPGYPSTVNIPACALPAPSPDTRINCWDTVGGAFKNTTLNLVAPGPFYITATFFSTPDLTGASIATQTAVPVVFDSNKAGKVLFAPAYSEAPTTAGPYITSLTSALSPNDATGKGSFSSMQVGQTNTFTVAGNDGLGVALAASAFGWSVGAKPTIAPDTTVYTCDAGANMSSASGLTSAFSGAVAGNVCRITLNITAGTLTTKRTWDISIANATAVTGSAATPAILKVSVGSASATGGSVSGDSSCSLSRPSGGAWLTTTDTTCPTAFKLASKPYNDTLTPVPLRNDLRWYNPQTNFAIFTVQYGLNGGGLNPDSPPSLSISHFCSNDAFVYDPALANADGTPAVFYVPSSTGVASGNPGYEDTTSKIITGGYPVGCTKSGINGTPTCLNISSGKAGDAFWPSMSMSAGALDGTLADSLTSDPTYWVEPVITNTHYAWNGPDATPPGFGPAPLCNATPLNAQNQVSGACTATPATTGTTTLTLTQPIRCSYQVIVTNQGAKDRLLVFAYFK